MIAILITSVLSSCPLVLMELRGNTASDTVQDELHQKSAERGCIKYYGEGSCLVRFIKKADLNYYAICRRKAQ